MILHIHFRPEGTEKVEFFCDTHGASSAENHGRSALDLAMCVAATEATLRQQGCRCRLTKVVDYHVDWDHMLSMLDENVFNGLKGVLDTVGDCDECDPRTQFVRKAIDDDNPVVLIYHECGQRLQTVDMRPTATH